MVAGVDVTLVANHIVVDTKHIAANPTRNARGRDVLVYAKSNDLAIRLHVNLSHRTILLSLNLALYDIFYTISHKLSIVLKKYI
jgi:hypothetical protein